MNELGLSIFLANLLLGFIACITHSYFWFRRWENSFSSRNKPDAFESSAYYLSTLFIWALGTAIILTVLGY